MNSQWARSDYQIKLYQVHHLDGLSIGMCRCPRKQEIDFRPFQCEWDCCKYELSKDFTKKAPTDGGKND